MDTIELNTTRDTNFDHRQAIEIVKDGVSLLDSSGRIYYLNHSCAAIFGYDNPQELVGKTLHAIYPEHEINRITDEIMPQVIKEGAWSGETQGLKKDHSPVHQEITLTRMDDGGIICISRDITARKEHELELQRMAFVAEKTNGIVMITDAERKVIWINDSFERILGYSAEEVAGVDPGKLLQGPETSTETIADIADSLRHTGTFSGEILNYTKSGDKIWLYLDIAAVYDDTGAIVNYVAVENDITVIKLAEQQLQESMEKERELNQFKTQFVNLASHQFRTPLATIRSSIDLLDLKMHALQPDTDFAALFQKHKAIIAEETKRMTELMENILDIGRINEGKIELCKKKLSFKQFMDKFVQSNAEASGQRRQLVYQFNARDRMIDLDEILFCNILRNIVSNAYKYSEGKPAPQLSVTYHDDAFFIQVRDEGIGIPEKDRTFLFHSFFRASNTKDIPGSGLGLMIAKKLITLHGGDIHIKSRTDEGSTVTIKLLV